MNNNNYKKNTLFFCEIACLALLLFVGIKFSAGFAGNLDISLYSEGFFLQQGLNFAREGISWANVSESFVNHPSALYSIWYALLAFFEPDAIALFYLNFKIITVLPALLIFIFLRKNDITIHLSLIMAWIMLVARGNVYSNPRISHFILLLILFLVFTINQRRSKTLTVFLICLGVMLMSVMLFGWSLDINVEYAANIPHDNMIKHLFNNFQFSVKRVPSLVFPAFFSINTWSPEIIAGIKNHLYLMQYLGKIIIPAAVLLFILALRSHPENRTRMHNLILLRFAKAKSNYFEYRNIFIALCCFLLPWMVVILYIHCVDSYLFVWGIIATAAELILVCSNAEIATQIKPKILLPMMFLMLFTPPYVSQSMEIKNGATPNLHTINFIKSLDIHKEVKLLDSEGGFASYLGDNFHSVKLPANEHTINSLLLNEKIDMIVLSHISLSQISISHKEKGKNILNKDIELEKSRIDNANDKFVVFDIPHTQRKLILKKNLIEERVKST